MFFRPMSHTHACRTGHRQDGSQQQGANPGVYRPAGSGRNPMQWRAPGRAMPGHHKEMMQILHAGLRPMRPAPEPEPPPPLAVHCQGIVPAQRRTPRCLHLQGYSCCCRRPCTRMCGLSHRRLYTQTTEHKRHRLCTQTSGP